MKCPKCGEDMEEGYVGVMMRSRLFWSKDEPKSARLSMPKGAIKLLDHDGWFADKKDWLRKGFRCTNCKLITFEY